MAVEIVTNPKPIKSIPNQKYQIFCNISDPMRHLNVFDISDERFGWWKLGYTQAWLHILPFYVQFLHYRMYNFDFRLWCIEYFFKARAEVCLIFFSFFGQWRDKMLLTFTDLQSQLSTRSLCQMLCSSLIKIWYLANHIKNKTKNMEILNLLVIN